MTTHQPGPQPRRRQRPGSLPLLALGMLAVTVAEVAVILRSGEVVGWGWTLVALVGMGVLGAWLWRREGARAWRALVSAFESGRLPAGELADAALVLVGGLLLMLPGFLTDVAGLFFLVPFTRPLARRLAAWVATRAAAGSGVDLGALRARAHPDTVIRGETVPDANAPATQAIVLQGEIEG